MSIDDLQPRRDAFAERFGAAPRLAVRVPGRVNLIGDHTDYHEGFVLPMAIDRAIVFLANARADRQIHIYSETLHAGAELDLDSDERHPEQMARYVQGVARVLAARYPLRFGCDVLIDGDLPPGGGLSSSSALVVGFGALLASLHDLSLTALDLATLGRDAEHWYGTTGGIMDQFVISHARAGQAVLLDCRSLHHELIPLPKSVVIVIANAGTRHNQIDSPFGLRRQEAEAALRVVQGITPEVVTLRDVEPNTLECYRLALLEADASGLLWRRCQHVVGENARVLAAASALSHSDLAAAGTLMEESHASLRDNYQVSSEELDAMVDAALASPGCFGARMTGGGFGGCTVNLVAEDAVADFCQSATDRYRRATSIEPSLFAATPADGVQVIQLA